MFRIVIVVCAVLLSGCETLAEMGPSFPDTRRQHTFQSLNDGAASVRLIEVNSFWNDGSHAFQTMQYEVTNHRPQTLCFAIRLQVTRNDLQYFTDEIVVIAPGATEVVASVEGQTSNIPIGIEEWDYLWTDDLADCY